MTRSVRRSFIGDSIEWDDVKVSHEYDKEKSMLSIMIQRVNGDSSWVYSTEIYAKYLHRSFFSW